MADESNDDKTFEATPKRRREAAEQGQIPKSQEVTTAFLLLASAGAIALLSGPAAGSIVEIFRMSIATVPDLPGDPVAVQAYLRAFALRAARGVLPFLLTLAVVALCVAGVQGRGVLTTETLTPKWSRLDPFQKAKQIWGWKAISELVKSLVKLAIVGVAVWLVLDDAVADIGTLGQSSPFALLDFMRRYTVRLLLGAGLAYLALALADYGFQVWQHEKQLRMTREEVKRETKDTEGDQVVKVRRRTLARQLTRRRMLGAVSEADVVVTNPTHIAVALKYDPAVAAAPVVIAMGERKVAERIKEIAKEAGVPMVENKPLARALFATSEVGRPIPVDLFMAVAALLAFVYKTRGGKRPTHGASK